MYDNIFENSDFLLNNYFIYVIICIKTSCYFMRIIY